MSNLKKLPATRFGEIRQPTHYYVWAPRIRQGKETVATLDGRLFGPVPMDSLYTQSPCVS
jgi:hypothetical protein